MGMFLLSSTRLAATCLCLVLLCSCASNYRGQRDLPAATTFNHGAGRGDDLMVTLRMEDGEELLFIVDTGCRNTTFDKSIESKLGKCLGTKNSKWAFEKTFCSALA